jgi:uncharacterized membrane protein YwzB
VKTVPLLKRVAELLIILLMLPIALIQDVTRFMYDYLEAIREKLSP